MCIRIAWIFVIMLMAAGGTSGPAAARGGGGGIGYAVPHAAFASRAPFATQRFHAGTPRIAGGRFVRRDDLGRGRGTGRNFAPVVAWPYGWSLDPVPEVIQIQGADAASSQPVIIAAGPPPQTAEPAALPDYSYVAGCRAIPGGYHCDPPHAAASNSR